MSELTRADAENYRFLRLYSIDFEMARQACDLCARQEDAALRFSVLRDLIVTYARPFSGNRGRASSGHRLPVDVVPRGMRALHRQLVALRNQVFAHTDQVFRNPQIARWPVDGDRARYIMGFADPSYERLLGQLSEIRALAEIVEAEVNARVRKFEETFEQFFIAPQLPHEDAQSSGADA